MNRNLIWIAFVALTMAGFRLLPVASFAQDAAPSGKPSSTPVDFVKDVQPILQKSCFGCHAEKAQMGGLRLDARSLALTGGQSGKSILPGKAAASPLYQRVAGIGDQARMPMGAKPLPPAQIETLRAWIDGGAVWPEEVGAGKAEIKKHWAYVEPRRPAMTTVAKPEWVRNPIDGFILAKLEQEKLAPSMTADKVTLLRRVSLDLTGLPPTLAEVDAFTKDQRPDAYERQVDRLLQSDHYGERWGRHWLDAARYADSDGYEKDKVRQVWFYRDWVIRALNRDLPFDRFVIEQLAGDLLPNATQDQIVATGFLRNSMVNEEGGVDPEQFRMEAMFDRMEAIGKSVLGVTIQCAQCHNHKFDPVTQEDYYRMFAFLNNSNESNVPVYAPQDQMKRAEIFSKVREVEAGLQHRNPDWQARMAQWERTALANEAAWTAVTPVVDDISTGGQKYLPMQDRSMLASGYAPTKHRVKLTVKPGLAEITAFRLELLNDPNLPMGGPGRSLKGTGALTEFEVESEAAGGSAKPAKIAIKKAVADLNLPERPLDAIFFDKTDRRRVTGPIGFAIDGKEETAWGTDAGPGLRNQPRTAVFTPAAPVKLNAGEVLHFHLSQKHGGWNSDDNQSHNLGRIRISVTSAPGAGDTATPPNVLEILAIPQEKRTPAQVHTVFSYWRTLAPEWKAENEEIARLWAGHPESSSQLILNERLEMRPTHLLTRGDFLKPARQVAPGVPGFLNALPEDAPANRLTFAKWMVDRKAPTTARAYVNRVWQMYFGTGLVSTSEDLGKQSETPSHPELLDWLAVEFMESGWRMKSLHRLIVTSATYRQSSQVTPELYARDPYNRLLARASRFRVEGEIVRDIALSASGLLNAKVGGPSVFPPAPEFLFLPPVSYGPKTWPAETGPERYRRALYTFRFRSVPYPVLQNFDAPNGDISCVRRSRSNTPLQALTTLNEPLFLEAAQALALKTLREGGDSDPSRLAYAFRRCTARTPTAAESSELLTFFARQRQRAGEGWFNAWEVSGWNPQNAGKLPEGTTPAQLAAWTAVSRVLLNLDETITKE